MEFNLAQNQLTRNGTWLIVAEHLNPGRRALNHIVRGSSLGGRCFGRILAGICVLGSGAELSCWATDKRNSATLAKTCEELRTRKGPRCSARSGSLGPTSTFGQSQGRQGRQGQFSIICPTSSTTQDARSHCPVTSFQFQA